MTIIALIALMILSGILGRMGGAKGYHTLYRDIGCSVVVVLAIIMALGLNVGLWWAYLAVFALHWASFSTYWDELFYGEDNLWFSGFAVGIAIFPICFIDPHLWWIVPARAVVLCMVWGSLNKYLPEKVLVWNRDVAEEFLRYSVSL